MDEYEQLILGFLVDKATLKLVVSARVPSLKFERKHPVYRNRHTLHGKPLKLNG